MEIYNMNNNKIGSMKVDVKEHSSDITLPAIFKSKTTSIIALFTSEDCAVILDKGKSNFKTFESTNKIIPCSNGDYWNLFNGEVVLKNNDEE